MNKNTFIIFVLFSLSPIYQTQAALITDTNQFPEETTMLFKSVETLNTNSQDDDYSVTTHSLKINPAAAQEIRQLILRLHNETDKQSVYLEKKKLSLVININIPGVGVFTNLNVKAVHRNTVKINGEVVDFLAITLLSEQVESVNTLRLSMLGNSISLSVTVGRYEYLISTDSDDVFEKFEHQHLIMKKSDTFKLRSDDVIEITEF